MLYIPKKEEIPIVAPTPTPFTKKDKPDYLSIEKKINKWNETSLDGVVLGSYGGEEFHLSEDEKIEIIKVVSATMSNKKFIIAGIDTASPTIALKLSEKYAHAGANMIRVRIPKIDKDKSNENVVDYFKTITDNSSIPVIVIHQPAISMDINLSPSELSEITHLDKHKIKSELNAIHVKIQNILSFSSKLNALKAGYKVAIIGPPYAGKST